MRSTSSSTLRSCFVRSAEQSLNRTKPGLSRCSSVPTQHRTPAGASPVSSKYIGSPRVSLKSLKANIKEEQLRKRSFLTPKRVALSPLSTTQYNYPWQQPWQQPFNASWHPTPGVKLGGVAWGSPSVESRHSESLWSSHFHSPVSPNRPNLTLLPEDDLSRPSTSSAPFERTTTPTHLASTPSRRDRFRSGDSVRFLEPELDDVEEYSNSSSGEDEDGRPKAGRGAQVVSRTATSFGIKGGRSVEEALNRNRVSFQTCETFPPEEITRMYRVFRLFRDQDASEVMRDDIPDIVNHLGYFVATKNDVDEIMTEVSEFSTFDFQEVIAVAERCAERERKYLEAVFTDFSDPIKDRMPVKDLMDALKTLGVTPLQTSIDEVLVEAELDEKEAIEREEFMRFLAIWRVTEGFRHEEVMEAQVAFRRFSGAPSRGSSPPQTPLQRDVHVSKIRPALQAMFSAHCADHVNQLLDSLDFDEERKASKGSTDGAFVSEPQGISFHEFLVFCRRVKATIVEEIQSVFERLDVEDTGRLPVSAIPEAMEDLNVTLFPRAVKEFLHAIGHEQGADLTLDRFVDFVQECRRCSGFRQVEINTFEAVFQRFDKNGNGTVESLELLDLLRYMGYTTSLEDVRRFIAQADPNATSGSAMDLTEFLRRMRLFRQEEVQSLRMTFFAHCDTNTRRLPLESCLPALTSSGNMPRAEVLSAALKAAGDLPTLSFEDFMGVVDRCREQTVAEKRKRAGFNDKSYKQISQLFNKHKKKGHDTLDKGEFLWFLIEIGVPVSTREERAEVFGLIDDARQSALKAGLTPEEVDPMGETSVTLWGLLHLLRLVLRKGESKDVENEERAMDTTGFLRSELQEFRSIFEGWVRREGALRNPVSPTSGGPGGRRSSLPHIFGDDRANPGGGSSGNAAVTHGAFGRPAELSDLVGADERDGRLTVEAMEMLLRSIGMRLDSRQELLLRARVSQVARAQDDGSTLSFADFLVIMRWMLDSNFADINEQSERIADRMTRATARGAPDKAMTLPSPTAYRRGSI